MIWERERGWFTTAPFSEPEVFDFPEGIGPVECVNVEHEEVLLVPRWVECKRVTFKYGLGDEFIEVLKTLHKLGLDAKDKIRVKGVDVAPRDVVAAALPDPMTLGDRMSGKTCAGTLVTGLGKDGSRARPTSTTWSTTSGRCASTARRPSCGRRLSTRSSRWSCSPRARGRERACSGRRPSPPQPFLDKLAALGAPHGVLELEPYVGRARQSGGSLRSSATRRSDEFAGHESLSA